VLYRGDSSLWRLVNGTSDVTRGLLLDRKCFVGLLLLEGGLQEGGMERRSGTGERL
jgi:hypothetical protein